MANTMGHKLVSEGQCTNGTELVAIHSYVQAQTMYRRGRVCCPQLYSQSDGMRCLKRRYNRLGYQ